MNNNQATIEIFNRSNYKIWNEDLPFALVMNEIDIALRVDMSDAFIDESTTKQKEFFAK